MAQSCTYTFNGPDGKEVTIRGMAAMKAYLVDGGMEFFQTKGVRFDAGLDVPAVLRSSDSLHETINVDGVDRPTKNSEGRPIHPTEDGIRNFWRWFGDSKAVDADGKPLVVYHGSEADITSFQAGISRRTGRASGSGGRGGFYFAQKPSLAAQYAGEYGAVYPVYLRIQNPMPYEVESGGNKRGEGGYKANALFPGGFIGDQDEIARALDAGYDGVIKGNEIAAFRPNQIKSATGNTGAFDPNEAPITLRDKGSSGSSAGADPSNQRITRAQADGFLADFLAKYANAPQITLVNTFDQLPATVQQEARNQGGNASDTKGVFHRGQVYLVAGNHSTVADFEATVFHEVIGHAGVRALFGPDFVKTANRLFMQLGGQAGLVKIMQRRGMGQQASDYIKGIAQAQRKELDQIRADMAAGKPGAQRRWNDAIARFVLTDEVFAHIAEQVKDRPSMMDKMKELIGKIRQWLRDKGFAELPNLGETDILFMLSKARQNMQGKDGNITRNGVTVSGNDLMTSDGRRLNQDDPDYASAMRLADLLGLRQEPGVTTFSIRRSMDDMSDRNRVASEQAPNPAGDGTTGGATPLVTTTHPTLGMRVPVRVVSAPGERGMRFAIEGGQATLRINPAFASDRQYVRTQMANGYALDDFLWPFGDDVFIRTSDSAQDYDHIKAGTHRGSKNHATGETEGGLSVSRQPAHAAGKHAYLVRGNRIGQGSDGEPLLDVASVRVASKRMSLSDAMEMLDDAIKERAKGMGLSAKELRALRTATDLDFSRINEPSAPVGSGVVPSTFRNEQGTIEVDGIQRPRTNSEGRPIHPTEDGIRNFWRWFGDSKMVDDRGRPLVLYHSSLADLTRFNRAGKFMGHTGISGISVTDNPAMASRYLERYADYGWVDGEPNRPFSKNIMALYVKAENPLFREEPFQTNLRLGAPLPKDYVSPVVQMGYDALVRNDAISRTGSVKHGPARNAIRGREIVVFNPEQIKSVTGNTGAFDPNEAPITLRRAPSATQQQGKGRIGAAVDSFLNGRNDMPEWLAQMPAETQEAARKAGIWTQQKPLAERLKDIRQNALKRLQQGLLDQFAPLKELGEREYVLARLTKSADAPLESLLLYGRPFMNDAGAIDVNLEKGGLIGALQDLNGEHDRFFAWIAGNRAEQLKKEGRENLFSDTDISALKDMNDGTMADGRSRKAVYESMLLKFNSYSKSVLDIAEKAGIIAKEDRAIWEKDFYVPFYRAMEDGEYKGPKNASGLVNQYAFKKLQGGTDNLNDLMQNTLRNWSHLLSASLKNQAAAAALTSAEKAGVAVPVSQKQKGSVSYLGRVKRKIPKGQTYTENGVQKVSDGTAEIETVGEKHFMVEDPFILDAITSLEWAGWNNPAMKWMQRAKHYLTLGVTISPTFKIRNLIRDQIAAIGLNPMSYNMMQNLSQGWKGTDKDSAEYAKMLAGGGLMRFGTFLEDDRAQHMKRLIDAGVEDNTILTSSEKVKAALGKAWDWWQEVGDRSENITRAAIYKQRFDQLVKEGKTQDEAHLLSSFAARDSMDFSLQGQWGSIRFLTQLVPFLNARLQGLYKLGRDGVAPTVRLVTGNAEMGDRERAQRFGAVVGTVALASIALMLAYEDDEDWKNREEWDRDTYWWFKVGDTAYRIPKPFEIGAIGTLAERGLETAMNGFDKESRRIFVERLGAMLTGTFAMNPVPQLFKPLIDLYANTDSFTGRPIETMGMERLSKSERIGVGTSATAQLIGKATSLVGLSPVQVDHLIDGYFSWLGTHLAMTADFALRPMMGLPDQPARKWPDGYFVVGDFAKDLPANQSRYLTQFYEQSKKVQEAMADIRYYQSIGMTEKAMKLSQENKDEIQLYKTYSAAQRQIGEINKHIRMVQMSGKDAAVKRDEIDRLTQARNKIAELTETRRAALQ